MPLLRFHNFQMVILFSFFLFVSISSTLPSKEQKSVFSSQENGAQQIPRIRTGESTDEEQPVQQNKNVKLPYLGASPEGQADEETSRLRNVAKDVEEKLGLDPPRGELVPSDRDNKNREIGNALPRSSGIRDESPGAINNGDGLTPLLALDGGAQQALTQGVGGVQSSALLAALLRQQRQLQQLSSARGNTAGIGTNLATLQALQQQRQQQDQQQLQQRRPLQQRQQQQIQALLRQVALQQQLLAGRRAAGGDARFRGIGAAGSSFRNNFEGSVAPSPSIFGPISGPTIPGPISVPFGLIPSSANTRRGTRISSGRSSPSGFLPSSTGASSFPGFGDPNALLLNLLRNAQGASSILSPPIITQQPIPTRVRSSPPSGTVDSFLPTLTGSNSFPDSAPPNSSPTVIRLVTSDVAQQQQPQQPQRELQQILDQEQRILGVLERESRSNQLVEGQRRELQTLQEQQQRILELLRAVTLRQDTVEGSGDTVSAIRRRNIQSNDKTKKTAEIATQQQPQGGDNEALLRQLLQSLLSNGIVSPQVPTTTNTLSLPPTQQFVPTAGQIVQQNPFATFGGDQQAGNILRPIPATVAGQSQQLQPQQLQQFLDLPAQFSQEPQQVQAVPGVGLQQQQPFGQDVAGQLPPDQQQLVAVLDPRTGQQFVASVATNGDNTAEGGGTVGEQTEQQQQVGAVPRGRRGGVGRKGAAGQQIAGGLAGGIGTIDGEAQLLSQLIQRAQGRNTEKIKGNEDEEEEETDEEEEDEDEDEEDEQ